MKFIAAIVLAFITCLFSVMGAGAWIRGIAPTYSNPLLSQRNVINLNFAYNTYDYAFINHFGHEAGSVSPVGTAFASTTDPWQKLIDQDGYPNNTAASGVTWCGSVNIPSSSNFAGPYVLTWDGDGQVQLASQTWTEINNTGTTYTKNSNGNWTNVAGKRAYIVMNVTTGGTPASVGLRGLTTGTSSTAISSISWSGGVATVTTSAPHGRTVGDILKLTIAGATPAAYNGTFKSTITGASTFTFPLTSNPGAGSGGTMRAFVTNIRFYRQADETDLLAGKFFRSGWKQNLVTLNPVAIRPLNWIGSANGNDDRNNRFENRNLPSLGGYGAFTNFTVSPVYPDADGSTTPNHWTVATATPTVSNTKTMPVTMQHGEIVTTRIAAGGSMVRAGSQKPITSIANGVNPNVACASHGYVTGDKVIMRVSGMTRLSGFPVTITVVDANNFTIDGVDTTSWGTFTSGYALLYITLNVGGRGAYPIVWTDGFTTGSQGGTSIVAGGYYTFYFDKTVASITDGNGAQVPGVWMYSPSGSASNIGHPGDIPLEIYTALINEVNEQSRAQGITNVVHAWLNLPAWGLDSNDPDYSAASNFPVNAVNTILNGSTIDGVTYAGLDPRASLIVEYSNETWNNGTKSQAYVANRGYYRWPASGQTNNVDMSVLRSVSAVRDIKAATGSSSRIKYTLGGQGFIGMTVAGINYLRINGSSTPGQGGYYYTTDILTVSGGWGTPISNHDAFNTASYFDPPTTYAGTTTGTGTFTDDSAMYNGEDNSANGGGNYTGAANPTQAIDNFVSQVQSGSGQTIAQYVNALKPAYGSAPTLAGKVNIEYEGAHDWSPTQGVRLTFSAGPTLSASQATFARAVINSSQWGTALVGYFTSVAGIAGTSMPAMYYMLNNSGVNVEQRWAYASPDSYAGGTEGQALLNNPAWVAAGSRNRALPN